MPTLQGAIDEIIAVIAAVDGINYAPSDPTLQANIWPTAITYATNGRVAETRASIEDISLHDIAIAVVQPLGDLVQATQALLPLYEPIIDALIDHLNGRTSNHYSAWRNVEYTLAPIDWPSGDVYYGYIFVIKEVKIQNDISG